MPLFLSLTFLVSGKEDIPEDVRRVGEDAIDAPAQEAAGFLHVIHRVGENGETFVHDCVDFLAGDGLRVDVDGGDLKKIGQFRPIF